MTAKPPIVIAIDGTSASGKSTNARLVARALHFAHVDTGAMYRTLAWYCLQKRVDVQDPKAVANACRRWKTELRCVDDRVQLLVDGYFPEQEIRSNEVSAAVPHVAAVPKVRDWMKKTQRECIKFGNLVMEGRDIGTVVFPNAQVKIFLDANPDERVRRRCEEMRAKGETVNTGQLAAQMKERDQRDSTRADAPLVASAVAATFAGVLADWLHGLLEADAAHIADEVWQLLVALHASR